MTLESTLEFKPHPYYIPTGVREKYAPLKLDILQLKMRTTTFPRRACENSVEYNEVLPTDEGVASRK